jgi:hypothetical protein
MPTERNAYQKEKFVEISESLKPTLNALDASMVDKSYNLSLVIHFQLAFEASIRSNSVQCAIT